jgi:aminopeptidase N
MKEILSFFLLFVPLISLWSTEKTVSQDPVSMNTISDQRDQYDVRFYLLDLNVSDSSAYIRGSVTIYVESIIESLNDVVLDFSDLLIADSVLVDGEQVSFEHIDNKLIINLITAVQPHDLIKVQIFYDGLGENVRNISGIGSEYNYIWKRNVTWTLSEPFYSLNWFPCKQSLTDKADSVYVFLSTDSNLKAGSNGLLTARVPLPDNRVRFEWKSRFPIAFYLISFAVSDYYEYSFYAKDKDGMDSIFIQNYIYDSTEFLDQNKEDIDKTGDLIFLFSDLFGSYPFRNEKYGHCVAPMGGGMEHQTMTTLSYFSFLLIAHELAHQWFGDYVTCSSWQDIWVNEGFASYAEYIATQYLKSQTEADNWIKNVHHQIKESSNGSVYVPENLIDDEDRIFDYRLTYQKGAAIIHMIRQEVNDDKLFFDILKEFLNTYKNRNASGMDFKNLLEEMTGKDFGAFFNQWYYGEGYPVHSINWVQQNDTLYINSLQTASSRTQLFNVLLEFNVNVNNRDTLLRFRQTGNFNRWSAYLPGNISSLKADPHQWLLIDITQVTNENVNTGYAKLKVVPNPAKENINIYYNNPSGEWILYLVDSSGKILMSEESHEQSLPVSVEEYPSGIYFVIIKEKAQICYAKFIKK